MSQLATRWLANLFGMKCAPSLLWLSEVVGKWDGARQEEYTVHSRPSRRISRCSRGMWSTFVGAAESPQASHYRNNFIKQAIAEQFSGQDGGGLKDGMRQRARPLCGSPSPPWIPTTRAPLRLDDGRDGLESGGARPTRLHAAAYSQLAGVPYVWAATRQKRASTARDSQYCYRQAGIAIPRNSEDQLTPGARRCPGSPGTSSEVSGGEPEYIGDDRCP